MIRWLLNKLRRRDAFGYRPGERQIFWYHDGRGQWKADPLAVQRRLLTAPDFDPKADPMVAAVPTIQGVMSAGRVAAAVRYAFDLPSFNAGGLTDAECLALYVSFGEYMADLQEQARPLASSPGPSPASESTGSPIPSSAASG